MVIYSEDVVLQILRKIRTTNVLRLAFNSQVLMYKTNQPATEQEILDEAVKLLGMIKEEQKEDRGYIREVDNEP